MCLRFLLWFLRQLSADTWIFSSNFLHPSFLSRLMFFPLAVVTVLPFFSQIVNSNDSPSPSLLSSKYTYFWYFLGTLSEYDFYHKIIYESIKLLFEFGTNPSAPVIKNWIIKIEELFEKTVSPWRDLCPSPQSTILVPLPVLPFLSFFFFCLAYVIFLHGEKKERKRRKRRREKKGQIEFRCVYSGLRRGRAMDGRKEGRKTSVHTVINSCTMDGPILSPPFCRSSFMAYRCKKKKGLDSPKGLSLQCFYLGLCTVIVYTNAKCLLPSVAHSSLGFRGQQWATKRVFVLFPFLRYLRRSFTKIHERSWIREIWTIILIYFSLRGKKTIIIK